MNNMFHYLGVGTGTVFMVSSFFISSPWSEIVVGVSFFIFVGLLIERSITISHVKKTFSIGGELGRIIFEDIPVGIIVYDTNFRVLKANQALLDLFELSSSDLPQKLDASLASDDIKKRFIQSIFSTLAPTVIRKTDSGEYPSVMDVIFSDPSLHLRVVTQRVFKGGESVGFVKMFIDKSREAELLRSKSEFIGVAAHQLRTPLTAIHWAFEGLKGEQLTDPQKELVETGNTSIENALRTVNSLLDVSKIEEGKFGYSFVSVNLVSYLEELLKEVYSFAKESGIKLYFEKPQRQYTALLDKEKMRMVFLNLLDNAVKYNVDNGEVTVRIRKEEDEPYIGVSIEDTGIGIAQDEIPKLFQKFFRAENAVKTIADGTGLGLYIARNIVKGHGGEIRVASELKRGSTFTVLLPLDSSRIPKHEPSLLDEL